MHHEFAVLFCDPYVTVEFVAVGSRVLARASDGFVSATRACVDLCFSSSASIFLSVGDSVYCLSSF